MAYYCREVDISDCHFRDCGNGGGSALHFEGSHFIEARDCVIEGGRRGIAFVDASGVVNNCNASGCGFYAIVVVTSTVVIADCRLFGVDAGLYGYYGAHVTADRTSFRGQGPSLSMSTSTATLRNCTILNGGGASVKLNDHAEDPAGPYDLRENWWGVADSTQIADWIIDVNDDPEIGAEVQFMPFLDHQVPVEKKTLGGLKALFR